MSDEQGGPDGVRRRGRRAAPKRSNLVVLASGVRSLLAAAGGRMRTLLARIERSPLAARLRPRLVTTAGWVSVHRQPVLIAAAALVAVGTIGGTMAVAGLATGGDDARRREAAGVGREASVESVPGRATPNSPPDPVPHRDAPAPSDPADPTPEPAPDETSDPLPDDVVEPVVEPPTGEVVAPEDDHPGRGKGPKWER